MSRVHEDKSQFRLRCNLDGCVKEYTKANSFVRHVRSRHVGLLHSHGPEDDEGQPELLTVEGSAYGLLF